MSTVEFRWEILSDRRLTIAPVLMFAPHSGEVIVSPGDRVCLDPSANSVDILVDVPGYRSYWQTESVKANGTTEILLRESDLVRTAADQAVSGAARQKASFKLQSWLGEERAPSQARAPASQLSVETPRYWRPLAVEIATPQTPTRLVAVPPSASEQANVSKGERLRIVWEPGPLGSHGPQVEPGDTRASLVLDYLLDGKYALAAAAATALQTIRGFEHVVDWVSESYEQLLVGYAFALANQTSELAAWVRRTTASQTLGTDGLVLTAHARWLERDHGAALDALRLAAYGAPPAVSFGVILGLQLADRYLGLLSGTAAPEENDALRSVEDASPPLVALRSRLMELAVDTAPFAGTVSLPRSPLASTTDISRSPWRARLAWVFRYWLIRWRFRYSGKSLAALPDLLNRRVKGDQMAQRTSNEPRLSGAPLYVAIGAVVIWLAFTIYMLTKTGSSEVTWSRVAWVFASVEAVAFAAAGALFGTAVQRERVEEADKRATKAESTADENRDMAVKGRAFAADVQARAKSRQEGLSDELSEMGADAEGPADPTLRHLDEISRSLFGDLV